MRPLPILALIALLALSASAEDIVRLRRGGSLRGTIRSKTEHEVILVMASGEIRIPRSQVARIESASTPEAESVRVIQRDEWSLLVDGKRVAGWIRVLHWERDDQVHLEEHRVLFKTRGSPRHERRRVEIVTRAGVPREYLWMESRPGAMEVWSGQIAEGRHVRQHRKDGRVRTETAAWPDGASLPLPCWAHAFDHVGAVTRVVLDPRSGKFEERRFRRGTKRYFGAQWNGSIVATTAARVAFAREVHARVDPARLAAEAKLHPLTPRDPQRKVFHIAAGLTLTAPDPIWVESIESIEEGRLLVLENRSSFARVEVYGGPVADSWNDLRLQLGKTYDHVAKVGEPDEGLQRLEIRQGKERMLGLLRVLRRKGDYVAVLGLVPLRKWAKERDAVAGVLRSATIVP